MKGRPFIGVMAAVGLLAFAAGYLVSSQLNKYVYVRIFDGFFPVPANYFLQLPSQDVRRESEFSFVGPNYPDTVVMNLLSMFLPVSSYINIGRVPPEGRRIWHFRLIEEKVMYGLYVDVYSIAGLPDLSPEIAAQRMVRISDDASFVTVFSPHEDLWLDLIQAYGAYNDIPVSAGPVSSGN